MSAVKGEEVDNSTSKDVNNTIESKNNLAPATNESASKVDRNKHVTPAKESLNDVNAEDEDEGPNFWGDIDDDSWGERGENDNPTIGLKGTASNGSKSTVKK